MKQRMLQSHANISGDSDGERFFATQVFLHFYISKLRLEENTFASVIMKYEVSACTEVFWLRAFHLTDHQTRDAEEKADVLIPR